MSDFNRPAERQAALLLNENSASSCLGLDKLGSIKTLADVINIVKNYAAERHPKHELCVIFGSYAKGLASQHSDVDIMIFRADVTRPLVERVVVDGTLLEVQIGNVEDCLYELKRASSNRFSIGPESIVSAVYVSGSEELFKLIKVRAGSCIDTESLVAVEREKRRIQFHLTMDMAKLIRSEGEEALFLACRIAFSVQELCSLTEFGWIFKGLTAVKRWKSIDSTIVESVYSALREGIGCGDYKKFCETILNTLSHVGISNFEIEGGPLPA